MANFMFNSAKLAMATTPNTFDWMADQIVGVLYDSRVNPTPAMGWADIASFEVSTSGTMSGREVTSEGRLRGDTLEFLNVTTPPGLKIRGMLLKFQSTNDLICNYTEGLDGFSGNPDLNLEALNINIYARTSAAQANAWIAL